VRKDSCGCQSAASFRAVHFFSGCTNADDQALYASASWFLLCPVAVGVPCDVRDRLGVSLPTLHGMGLVLQ
jgi:hypothetical protein